MASSHCRVNLRHSVVPAQTPIQLLLQLQWGSWDLDTDNVNVFRLKVDRVSPIPVTHLDLQIPVYIKPQSLYVKARRIAFDDDWEGFQMYLSTSFELSFADSRGLCLERDRKSTRLNSSHVKISYAVFCLKKKRQPQCM